VSGSLALKANTTGANNIAVGFLAGSALTNGNSNIYIGNSGGTNESGIIRIGDTNVHTATYLAGDVYGKTLNPTSDRNAKEQFRSVDPVAILNRVLELPITRWNFKGDAGTPHIGPMAQDFHAAFGVGVDDKHIATVDADGVALAAIQGLNQRLQEKEIEIQSLKDQSAAAERSRTQQVEELKSRLGRMADLESRLARLEALLTAQNSQARN
jgi:hypothetical protein